MIYLDTLFFILRKIYINKKIKNLSIIKIIPKENFKICNAGYEYRKRVLK